MAVLAVVAAAFAGFLLGGVWYMVLSRPWAEAAGIELDAQGRPAAGMSVTPFVISGLCMLLVAGLMRYGFALTGIDSPGKGLASGLGIGAFFIAPWMAMNYGYAMRPLRLALIDGGYAILGPAVIGLVLTLF